MIGYINLKFQKDFLFAIKVYPMLDILNNIYMIFDIKN